MEESLIKGIKTVLESKNPGVRSEIKRLLVKEYLHSYVLDFIYNGGKYSNANFYGGTCLKYFFGLDRFSEDLDFDSTNIPSIEDFDSDFIKYFKGKTGYGDIEVKRQESEWGIIRFTIKLPVLFKLNLSPKEEEKIFVKVEFSTHKQHVKTETTPLLFYGKSFVVRHFDLPSMFSGKIIACLERDFQKGSEDVFVKGRDFYDLVWFMQKKIVPNKEKLLKDGAASYTTKSAFEELSKKISTLREKDVLIDLRNLVENETYAEKWSENFKDYYFKLLENYK